MKLVAAGPGFALVATLFVNGCGDSGRVAGGASSETENALARVLEIHVDTSLESDTLLVRQRGAQGEASVKRLVGDTVYSVAYGMTENDLDVRRSGDTGWIRLPSLSGVSEKTVRLFVARDAAGILDVDLRVTGDCPVDRICGLVRDARDGRTYGWVRLGKTRWLRRNMAFGDGSAGVHKGTGAYAPFDSLGSITNGYYYEWAAAANVACPQGWTLAGRTQWNELELDITAHHSELVRAIGVWSGSFAGSDALGLTIRPSGYRLADGSWAGAGKSGTARFWTTQVATDTTTAMDRSFVGSDSLFHDDARAKNMALSVRCTSS